MGWMVAMPCNIDGVEYLTISEAVDYMGCTDGWVRMLCRQGKLDSRLLGQRMRLVRKSSATHVRDTLTTRANAKRHLAKRPAAKRKKAKRKK